MSKNEKPKLRVKTAFSLILVLLLSMTIATIMPAVQAVDYPSYLEINVTPNPIGVGQTAYINVFLTKPPSTASMGTAGQRYENITLDITHPDGTKQTLGPYQSDAVGGAWVPPFVPTQIGTYTFKAHYAGQTLSNGVTYMPSDSVAVTLVVQQAPIQSYSSPALPSEYWSRPIYATNYNWAQLGSNWYGLGLPAFTDTGGYDATGNFQPFGTAPNTGHIIWTKPTAFGGQPGLPTPGDQEHQYESTSILFRAWEPVILNGILYYVQYPSFPNVRPCWVAVDIRTGETVWTKETTDLLRMGQVFSFHTIQEYGSIAILWGITSSGPLEFHLYDAMTGASIANIVNATPVQGFLSRTSAFLMNFNDDQGSLLTYYSAGGKLNMWNSTQAMAYPTGDLSVYAEIIRPSGNISFTSGIQWSVPIPTQVGDVNITGSLGIGALTPEVILLRTAPSVASQTVTGYQITAGMSALTGQLLWGPLNQTISQYQDVAIIGARNGVYILHNKDTNEAYGYSLQTGQMMWGPVQLTGNAYSTISRAAEVAYGIAFIWDFGGYVNALNATTGKVLWTYVPSDAGYDTPYGVYPLWQFGTQGIADGKLFLSQSRMYNPPLFPNASKIALDCFTGELVWSEMGFYGREPAAFADGYMLQWNSYDNQIYSVGKGPTKTTVSAPQTALPTGTTVLISGRVTDESPGTKDSDRTARFPNGVPAIADGGMSKWMEYLYMQQPKPTDATGVQVHLTAIDPNGNFQDIGTTTSNSLGDYALTWTPPVPGLYTITAAFVGSESYFGSEAGTSFVVSSTAAAAVVTPVPTVPSQSAAPTSAPTQAPTSPSPNTAPQPTSASPTTTYIAIAAAFVIIAVAATTLYLRKNK